MISCRMQDAVARPRMPIADAGGVHWSGRSCRASEDTEVGSQSPRHYLYDHNVELISSRQVLERKFEAPLV